MAEPDPDRPSLPALRLRVGVTGARALRADQIARIERELQVVFAQVRDTVHRLSLENAICAAYSGVQKQTCPDLLLISPLARGSDRLAARTALALPATPYSLYVPMPFAKADYERDFTGRDESRPEEPALTAEQDLADFRNLLAQASGELAFDGDRENPSMASRAYEAVGRFVIRHSDLLVAVWDGGPGHGRGGTAEIIHYAAMVGVPVWWIHATEATPPQWISSISDLRGPQAKDGEKRDPAADRLNTYLAAVIEPPRRVRREESSWIGQLASLRLDRSYSPAAEYFAERAAPPRAIWTIYSRLMNWAAGGAGAYTPAAPSDDPIVQYWFTQYRTADKLAAQKAARYRSTYVLVIIAATVALLCGAVALGFAVTGSQKDLPRAEHAASQDRDVAATNGPPQNQPAPEGKAREYFEAISLAGALCELAALGIIIGLVAAALRFEWHARSIEYRLLAELFRKQEVLAPLGWALPIANVQQLADTEHLSWLGWLFAAMQRAAPLPTGELARSSASRLVLERLVDEQLSYHRARSKTDTHAAEKFEKLGTFFFTTVIVCVVIKIMTELFRWPGILVVVFGLLATVLPGVSAAIVGIRRYAELEMLADQSRHMILQLERARERIVCLNPGQPLVSQELGAEAAAVATMMLRDLEGWGRLFRGKLMEAA